MAKDKNNAVKNKKSSRIADGLALMLIFGLLDLILFGVFGASGKIVGDFFRGVFGYSLYGISLGLTLFGLLRMCNLKIRQTPKIIALYVAIIILMITFAHIYTSHQLTSLGYSGYIKESFNQANTAGGVILSCVLYPFATSKVYILSLVANGVFLAGLIIIAILLQVNIDINVERFSRKKNGKAISGQNANIGMFDVDYQGNANAVVLNNQTIEGRDLGNKIIGSRNSLETYVPFDRLDMQADSVEENTQSQSETYAEEAQLILDTAEIAREAGKSDYAERQQSRDIDISQAQRDIFGVDNISSMNVINEGRQDKPIEEILNNNNNNINKPQQDYSQYNSFSTNERMRIIQENTRRSRERRVNEDATTNNSQLPQSNFAQTINNILNNSNKLDTNDIVFEEKELDNNDFDQNKIDSVEKIQNNDLFAQKEDNKEKEEVQKDVVEDRTEKMQGESMDEFFAKLNRDKEKDNNDGIKLNNYNIPNKPTSQFSQPSDGYFDKKPATPSQNNIFNKPVSNTQNSNVYEQKQERKDVRSNNVNTQEEGNEVANKPRAPYVAPNINNLKDYGVINSSTPEDDCMEKAKIIEDTYGNFNIKVSVKNIVCGPVLTRYEFEIPQQMLVEKIGQLKKTLMMQLKVKSMRIEAPIPGKDLCGIEIPNKTRKMVGLKEFLQKDEFKNFDKGLYFALGKDIDGNCKFANLAEFPHGLIAGGTGSGKSICLNTMLISLIYKYSPDELRIVLVDPKIVEFGKFRKLPHLLTPQIYNTPKEALTILKWLVDEMTRRYSMLDSQFVNNIASYNKIPGIEKMPFILAIIDEVGDIMVSEYAKEFENLVLTLTQKARAAGIHLILSTQRPSADVITGTIKANLATRIAFAVTSSINSKIILESQGAEDLLGKGDMLYTGNDRIIQRLQGPYIDEEEVRNIMIDITQNNEAYYDSKIIEQIKLIHEPPKQEDPASAKQVKEFDFPDELCPEVLRKILQMENVTISSLQRVFTIGFPRGGKIFDWLIASGYIEKNGNKHTCCLTSEQVEQIIENARNKQE